MNIAASATQSELLNVLLNVAVVRPVFIWGAPGIGKSSIVEQFAHGLGLDCISLLGSQLAPEDIIGVPQILDGKSVFCLPRMIARDAASCLFLDELNAGSQEVQKAFTEDRLVLHGCEHAFLIPDGARLPFAPRGKVFRIRMQVSA
jgi:MoxR-like ATPase